MSEVKLGYEDRLSAMRMMLEDSERVIFYLLRRLGKDVDEINVLMNHGSEMQSFKIKKPEPHDDLPQVHRIEYSEEL